MSKANTKKDELKPNPYPEVVMAQYQFQTLDHLGGEFPVIWRGVLFSF